MAMGEHNCSQQRTLGPKLRQKKSRDSTSSSRYSLTCRNERCCAPCLRGWQRCMVDNALLPTSWDASALVRLLNNQAGKYFDGIPLLLLFAFRYNLDMRRHW